MVLAFSAPLWAQTSPWYTNVGSNTWYVPAGVNAGIGISNAAAKLHVFGLGGPAASGWNTYTMARFSDGGQYSNSAIVFDTGATGPTAFRGFTIPKNSQAMLFGRYSYDGSGGAVYDMTIDSNGNVGIGTMSPAHLLHVAGAIGAQEIIVSSTGADYVFAPGYRLAPLSEVNSYIQAHHHLPGIPSATEGRENGVSLGEMQSKLLAKIEELTLHLIRQEDDNRELRQRIVRLEGAEVAGSTPTAGK